MPKVSVIGAGNVGGLTAMRLLDEAIADIFLIDIAPGVARAKQFDLEDSSAVFKRNYSIVSSEDIAEIKESDVVIITAGFPRRPGMKREDLLKKNAQIFKKVCPEVRRLAPHCIVIVVTNPLDIMTYLTFKITGFRRQKVIGMGASLDSARFANLISRELNVPNSEVEALVIGSHGEGMLPLRRFSYVKNVPLEKFISNEAIDGLIRQTINRGAQIVKNLGGGSAYFAPSAAITVLVKAILKDEKRNIPVSCYLEGEYGIRDVCIGVPCRIGRGGIEQIIELELNSQEKEKLLKSAEQIKMMFHGGGTFSCPAHTSEVEKGKR